jgi:hypothetical protein
MKAVRIAAVAALALGLSAAYAGNPAEYNLAATKQAVQGYDVVSYFKGAPAKGSETRTVLLDGVFYLFANEDNRKAFQAAPEKYKPAYGGWCATAMAKGEKVEIDPKNYKITNGRLFLFYNGFWGNAIKDWNKDEANLTTKADAAWKKISGE